MQLIRNFQHELMRLCIPLPLLFCAVICIFYRTANNHAHFAFDFLTLGNLDSLKSAIQSVAPLNDLLIYSIPEGLWVFSLTLLGSRIFVKIANKKIHFTHLAIIFALGLEACQFLHLTNGTFDVLDIIASLFFWTLALLLLREHRAASKEKSFLDIRMYLFIIAFCSVYFSDTIVG